MRPPAVLTLAQTESFRRVIPADRVGQIERVAETATSASQRIERAEAHCIGNLNRWTHAAWQRGFARGHADAMQRLHDFVATLDERRKAVDVELIALVRETVSKIVRDLPLDLVTDSIIVAALDEAQAERGRAVLRVHPDRVAGAQECLSRKPAGLAASLCITIEADPAMAEGDCTLETASGAIHAGLQVQLDALFAAMNGEGS